jgi:hypothetical protein
MDPPTSLFERWIARPRTPWLRMGISVAVVAAPLVAAALDGVLADFFTEGLWRSMGLPAAIIVYILAVAGPMSAMESRVIRSFRPVILLTDEELDRLLRSVAVPKPVYEALAIGGGLLVGLWAAKDWPPGGPGSWLDWTGQILVPLMYGLLAWLIYASFAETRLMNVLLRQPLRVDPLDTTPFEPIGRRSLLVALAFIGGSTLSLVFVGSQPGGLRNPAVWVVYGILALVTAAIFFLNMRATHHVLAAARKAELHEVRAQIAAACRALSQCLANEQPSGTLPTDLNALVIYEGRLKEGRTWPYNTAMLRTLVLSGLIPLAPVVGRTIVERFLR